MPHSTPKKSHRPTPWLVVICGAALLLSCTPEKPTPPSEEITTPPHPAETALATQHATAGRPDLALAVLAAHPGHEQTMALLRDTRWHLPTAHLDHPGLEIQHIAIHAHSLWVALAAGPFHTLVRWNLDTLEIEAILFPDRAPIHSLVISPTASHAVLTRGSVSLLIDAHTLQPIANLGKIPEHATAESTTAFTSDSILVAHPTDTDWHIRDTATGEIIRSIPHEELESHHILAAHIDHHRLRLLAANGTRTDIPVSPVDPIESHPFDEAPLEILHAHIIAAGDAAIIIRSLGPHQPPAAIEFAFTKTPDPPFDLDAWATRQPHSPLANLANGLLRHLDPPPVTLAGNAVRLHGTADAPLATASTPVAFATDAANPARTITAETTGRVTLHTHIQPPDAPSTEILTAIAGHQYHPDTASLTRIPPDNRLRSWDSQTVAGTSCPQRPPTFTSTTADHLLPLWHRLADALPPDSPELESFPNIATPTDHSIAHDLAAALIKHADPATVAAALESAENIPPVLLTLATAHIHERIGNTAAALQPWHDRGFPDLDEIRRRQDWRGWEQPDFQPAVDALQSIYRATIAAHTIRPTHTEDERRQIITRLTSPEALHTLGRARLATACLDAATILSTIDGEMEATLQLAYLARHYGAPTAPCLRAEAIALTAMGDYAEAHTRWIDLITHHPEESHQPADYTEAAYTAFENDAPRQSIEILITGIHRFSEDPEFALRAAWIALLTGNPGHARAFLLKGRIAGFPEAKTEHATALLTIAAVLDHDAPAANAHFQDLITLDPAWADPETLEALPWPDHLKAALRQLSW